MSIQTIHSLKCLKWPYKGNGSLKGDNLVVIYFLLSASEIWPDKRPGVAILVRVTCRNSIPRVDMLLHLDTLSTHWANPSLFLLLNVATANYNFVVFTFCLSWQYQMRMLTTAWSLWFKWRNMCFIAIQLQLQNVLESCILQFYKFFLDEEQQ